MRRLFVLLVVFLLLAGTFAGCKEVAEEESQEATTAKEEMEVTEKKGIPRKR